MKWGKIILIIFGAIMVTALGIDAADTVTGSRGTLLSELIGSRESLCPVGMVHIEAVPSLSCIDAYENSTGSQCPTKDPENILSTQNNVESAACTPETKAQVLPWRYISRDLAMRECARVGKRLPTSAELYELSLSIPSADTTCNISSHAIAQTGTYNTCVSAHGVYDLVGNLWEWTSDDVINGKYQDEQLPNSGYVAQVDKGGMATLTKTEAQTLFGSDYFWSRADGSYGIIRGGYYDSNTDAGIYTVHADTLPTDGGPGIGFRCVK